MIGRVYRERGGGLVVVEARWGPGGGPRNVLVVREDGSRVVRPFRGLRRTEVVVPAGCRVVGRAGRDGGLEPVGTLPGGEG